MNTILKEKITDKCAWIGQEIADKTDWIHHLSAHTLNVLDQGLKVLELTRISIGSFTLDVKLGEWRYLTVQEERLLKIL